ncbi:MAG TPA: Rnase Y domain-containing protein, partial [Fibrella sp.]
MTTTSIILMILSDLVAVGIGIFVGRKMLQSTFIDKQQEAESKAADILKTAELQAETIKKDRMLEAKEKFLRLKAEFEEQTSEKRGLL